MSTKIGNGYRLRATAGCRPDLFTFTARLRAALEPVHQDLYVHTVAAEAAGLVDRARLAVAGLDVEANPGPLTQSAAAFAVDRQIDRAHATPDGDDLGFYDFRCEVVFLADQAVSASGDDLGDVYALLFTNRDEYVTAWERLDGVEEYGFWNGTDTRPPGVDAAEWADREQIWARVLGRAAPVERGLVWQLFGRRHPLSARTLRTEIGSAIPSRPERARYLARARVSPVIFDGGSVRLRPVVEVRADIDREVARIEPLLEPLTESDLYDFRELDLTLL